MFKRLVDSWPACWWLDDSSLLLCMVNIILKMTWWALFGSLHDQHYLCQLWYMFNQNPTLKFWNRKSFSQFPMVSQKSCFLDVTECGNNLNSPLALFQVVWVSVLSRWSPIRSGQFVSTVISYYLLIYYWLNQANQSLTPNSIIEPRMIIYCTMVD